MKSIAKKTTTVAKIGHLLKENNISSAIVAGDTFRSGAIEQIKEHADRLELKLIIRSINFKKQLLRLLLVLNLMTFKNHFTYLNYI